MFGFVALPVTLGKAAQGGMCYLNTDHARAAFGGSLRHKSRQEKTRANKTREDETGEDKTRQDISFFLVIH
jgi:hypothetical protein